ncbi:hypothetical protein Sango_0834400 [Sesamum angolense]|uniref:Uncharacterized protein n=1 Tax=Sesamum angolense TaxID=2727404 RepID=A0AAE2C0M1_9LAMI|nr:hypothetical protein Sango_0834400 [Sesamum angolense]
MNNDTTDSMTVARGYLTLSSSKTQPFLTKASAHTYCKRFSSHFRCKNSHKNSVAVYPGTVADRVLMDIENSGIIACLRAQSAEMAIEAARAALSGGISVMAWRVLTDVILFNLQLEITMSTPGVFEVGTVLDSQDAKDALKCGAKFLMSPAMVKILLASRAGAKIVKVYPVSALGGVQYIAAVKKPFPNIQMIASQGITIDSVGQYIGQGASSVVLSDAIFEKNAIDAKYFDRINQLACSAAFMGSQAVRKIRDNLS